MRVGIDAHCLGQRKTGNETYTSNLVNHLGHLERDGVDYTIYVGADWKYKECLFNQTWFRPEVIRPFSPLIRIPIGYALQSRKQNLDLFHAQYMLPNHLRCRTVLTVHDVLFERFPEFFTKWHTYSMKAGVRWSCHRADHIITVSEATKRDLIDLYGLDTSKITVTYLGADSSYRQLDRDEAKKLVRDAYGIEEEFLLFVGAIQPRKNISRLLSAFAKAKQELRLPHKLVVVGPKSWLSEKTLHALEANPAKSDIIFTGYIPHQDLPYFYNAATAFAYISICEGFGLPVLEAMACGTPTITSRGSSLEEIAGDGAVLVDPTDEDAVAEAVGNLLSNSDLRDSLRRSGLARSKRFSWRRMAEETQSIYRRLVF